MAWPRRPRRLANAVVEDLVDRIVGGESPEGASLPIEPVLCETFGLSRTDVREAVKTLESVRLVRVQGHGTTVRPLADWDLLNPLVRRWCDMRRSAPSSRTSWTFGAVGSPRFRVRADVACHDAILAAPGTGRTAR